MNIIPYTYYCEVLEKGIEQLHSPIDEVPYDQKLPQVLIGQEIPDWSFYHVINIFPKVVYHHLTENEPTAKFSCIVALRFTIETSVW